MWRIASGLTAALFLLIAWSPQAEASSNCQDLASGTFDRVIDVTVARVVYTGTATALAAQEAARAIETGYERLVADLGPPGNSVTICVARSRRDISAPGLQQSPDIAGGAVAASRTAVIAADSGEVGRLALHEMAHLFAGARAQREGERPLPHWLGEGLAEVVSRAPSEIEARSHALDASGALPGLRWLEANSPANLRGEDREAYYVGAAMLTSHLIREAGWGGIWRMLLITGKLPANLDADARDALRSGTGLILRS